MVDYFFIVRFHFNIVYIVVEFIAVITASIHKCFVFWLLRDCTNQQPKTHNFYRLDQYIATS